MNWLENEKQVLKTCIIYARMCERQYIFWKNAGMHIVNIADIQKKFDVVKPLGGKDSRHLIWEIKIG